MGTRNLICVQIMGEIKLAQYSQWDGCIKGQGQKCVDFLKKIGKKGLPKFGKVVKGLEFYSDKEIKSFETTSPIGVNIDLGADILDLVYNKSVKKLVNDIDFAKYSLFCEWAYVLNLDKYLFEIYEGFNHNPIKNTERFYNNGFSRKGYYPVKLLTTISFNRIFLMKKPLALVIKTINKRDE